jgi:TolA-binding protein
MLRDFLQLQMALCLINTKDFEQASQLLVLISESTSPIVRIISNYRLSLLEIQRKRYLKARTRAYKALALIKAVDFDDDWALSFECDCYFLAAECLTRYVLSLSNADKDVPAFLWSDPKVSLEPFDNLSESQLRSCLCSGSEHLNKGLLIPKIVKFEGQSLVPRWSVTCYGAPIEELLAKYATSTEIDIRWSFKEKAGSNLQSDMLRLSPATLYLPTTDSQQILLISAGSTGLLAGFDETLGTQLVTIYNPSDYTSLREHIDFLGQQAISLWRKFVLRFNSDNRLGNAHFAMGLLQSKTGMAAEAIAEYKLVANRFSQTPLAPYALLHSSIIKSDLHDYRSARNDLKQLIEQYPDTDIYIQAYLNLADVTKLAGLNAEAAQFYCRVYNFGLSPDSKIASAFGAAKCFYQIKAYEEAAVWLSRYIELAKGDHSNDLYTAYFLMGKTNLGLGQYEQASEAFQYAITEQNSREQYVEAVKALVQGHIDQENFIQALDALENTRMIALSEQQSIDMLLLKSEIYRMLGLVDTAIDILRNRVEYVNDSRLRIKITFELAKCYLANNNLEYARNNFSEVLRTAEPGPLAQSAALELADVCLRLEQGSQAISVCSQLLEMDISEQIKQKTLRILAEAYNQQKDYDKAVLALSGRWQ